MLFKNVENWIKKTMEENIYACHGIEICKNKKTIYKKVFGYKNFTKKEKLLENDLFRIYSMSKPITVLAFLKVCLENKIDLYESVSKYIPAFKNSKYISQNNELKNITDLKIFDLLTMQSGITYGNGENQNGLEMKKLWNDFYSKKLNLKQFVNIIADVPFLFNPSEGWTYGLNMEVLAVLIEVIENVDYREYIKKEIFVPLEMNDSDFYMFDKEREVKVFIVDEIKNELILRQDDNFSMFFENIYEKQKCSLAGSGVVTTIGDYKKFLNILLDGKFGEKQLFDKEILKKFSEDQLKEKRERIKFGYNKDYSYGFGVRVRVENNLYPKTEIGEWGWDGALGSFGLVDPKNMITVTLMHSSSPSYNNLNATTFLESLYTDLKVNKLLK